jgi:hypothetical protein
MSPLQLAEHAVHHREAHHLVTRMRCQPIPRTEVEALLAEYVALVAEHKRYEHTLRGQLLDYADRVAELEQAATP